MTARPYSQDSIARALAHHEAIGALLTCSPPDPPDRAGNRRKTWRVTLPAYGEPVDLTTPQAWALCLGLRAREIVAEREHEQFVDQLHAFADRPRHEHIIFCEPCAVGNHSGTNGTPGCDGGNCTCPCRTRAASRCGIHGDDTSAGRCPSCDREGVRL